MALKWKGDKVLKKIIRASKIGINKTMSHAVKLAKDNHLYINRSGTAERQTRVAEAAVAVGDEVAGLWGNVQTNYFKHLVRMKLDSLVMSSQVAYPLLARNIKVALK